MVPSCHILPLVLGCTPSRTHDVPPAFLGGRTSPCTQNPAHTLDPPPAVNTQVIENAQRRSVDGLSADYLMYSMLGYTAYAAYTAALHFNPGVQAAYMAAHGGSPPDVQLTDFLFAGHALLVTLYTLYQCKQFGSSSTSSRSSTSSSSTSSSSLLATSPVCNCIAGAVFAAVAAYSGHIGSTCGPDDCDAWLPLLYLLGFIKVSSTRGIERKGLWLRVGGSRRMRAHKGRIPGAQA